MPKLKVDDIVEVHGWCMLAKIDAGKYRISKIENNKDVYIYSFTKPKGNKVIIRHYADNVDPWVKNPDNEDLNKITNQ